MSRKQSPQAAEAAPTPEAATPQAVVSALGEVPAEVNREPVVEDLGNGTVKETF